METQPKFHRRLVFGEYELECHVGELRRNGLTLKLQPQPARVLTILVRNAGQVVTRQELAEQVWGSETYVDFEHGLNFAIRQIRNVLEDDAERPRFLETVPKRGYRFIGAVKEAGLPSHAQLLATRAVARKLNAKFLFLTVGAAVIAAGLVFALYRPSSKFDTNRKIASLAVLPLHNLSVDPEQEYFSEGITDELITDLARVSGLRVISHTSVQRFKETSLPLPEIARELGVDAIIEGTIMRSGDRVRVTAQLIDSQSDQHIWANSYERDFRDVLSLQDEVAQQIAGEVGIKLTAGEQIRLSAAHGQVNPAAYDAYLKGAFYFDQMSCGTFDKALAYFQEAAVKDPKFAPAYSSVADSYVHLADWHCWQTAPLDKAEAAALQALELDPRDADAHAALGQIAFSRDWNWTKAGDEFSKAILLDPNDAGVHSTYGMYLVAMGKEDAGLAEVRKAQELDPVSEKTNLTRTWALFLAHRFDEAIKQAQQALVLFQSYGEYFWLGQCYEKKGMPDQAIGFYLKAWGGVPEEIPLRRDAYRKNGLPGYWQEDEQYRNRAKQKNDAFYKAMYFAHMQQGGKAIEQLELAYNQHCDGLQFLKVDPDYDKLRNNLRFKKLIAKLGL